MGYALSAREVWAHSAEATDARTRVGYMHRFHRRTSEMTISRIALLAATAFVVGCSSDDPTSPGPGARIEPKLAASAQSPTATIGDPVVTMRVAVTNSLAETVTGGVCAQEIEARSMAGTTWANVASNQLVCTLQAIQIAPGATANITAAGDQAKIRAAAGAGATSVVLRVRHTLAGSSTTYTLQSNELTWQLP